MLTKRYAAATGLGVKLYTLQSPSPQGTEVVGVKAKSQPGSSLASNETCAWRFTVRRCPFGKSLTETHVHCPFEEATRFMSTKLKDSNTQHKLEETKTGRQLWETLTMTFVKE